MEINKCCIAGNKAYLECLNRHNKNNQFHQQTREEFSLRWLCAKKDCKCRLEHNKSCRGQRHSGYIYLNDQLRMLQSTISYRKQRLNRVYRDEIFPMYKRMIFEIETEADQMLHMVEEENPRLYLTNLELITYNALVQQNVEFISHNDKSSYLNNEKTRLEGLETLIYSMALDVQQKLTSSLKNFRRSLLNVEPQNQYYRSKLQYPVIDERWANRRRELEKEIALRNFKRLSINKLELNGVVVPSVPDTFDLRQITALDTNSIGREILKNLSQHSKDLRELVIHSGICVSDVTPILSLNNLQKISITLIQDEPESNSCRLPYDCPYCNERQRDDQRDAKDENQRWYTRMVNQAFIAINKNNPKLVSLTFSSIQGYSDSPIWTNNVEKFASQYLKELRLTSIQPPDMKLLNKLSQRYPNLEVLQLYKDTQQEDGEDGEDEVQNQSQQEEQVIGNQSKPTSTTMDFTNLAKLSSLSLQFIDVTPYKLSLLIESTPNLTSLSLDGMVGQQEAISISLHKPRLQYLSLNSCQLGDEALISICKNLPKLTVFKADCNCFSNNGLMTIANNLLNLKHLSLQSNSDHLDCHFLSALSLNLPELEQFRINHSYICNSQMLLYLSKLRLLKSLSTDNYNLTNITGFVRISRNLPHTNLYLSLLEQTRSYIHGFNMRYFVQKEKDHYWKSQEGDKQFRNLRMYELDKHKRGVK